MSFHYLIDGYNLLYALPEIPPGPWPNKREILIELLLSSKPEGANRMTVIFDSRQGFGDRMERGRIEVVFTAQETADDWIIRRVRQTPNARALIVVTDDQGLRRMIRGTGAQWIPTKEFMGNSSRKKQKTFETEKPPLDAITEEFKKKWL